MRLRGPSPSSPPLGARHTDREDTLGRIQCVLNGFPNKQPVSQVPGTSPPPVPVRVSVSERGLGWTRHAPRVMPEAMDDSRSDVEKRKVNQVLLRTRSCAVTSSGPKLHNKRGVRAQKQPGTARTFVRRRMGTLRRRYGRLDGPRRRATRDWQGQRGIASSHSRRLCDAHLFVALCTGVLQHFSDTPFSCSIFSCALSHRKAADPHAP